MLFRGALRSAGAAQRSWTLGDLAFEGVAEMKCFGLLSPNCERRLPGSLAELLGFPEARRMVDLGTALAS